MKLAFPRAAVLALALAGTMASPLAAQNVSPEARLKKVEAEVRALQRKVFPESGGKYFAPEIQPPEAAPIALPPGGGPVTDMLARVDSVEGQLARLTGQLEENANRTRQLEARLAALEAAGNGAPAPSAAPGAAAAPAVFATAAIKPPAQSVSGSITGSVAANTSAMAQAAVAPTTGGLGFKGIVKPESDDKGEDEYTYGYRLWEAKYYPEAAEQLKSWLGRYPKHKRLSYARNLLGRAYLDEGQPGTAAQVFLQNYQADKKGERAPDSLLYLAVAMTRLKETQRACVALQEFGEVYPAEAAGRLSATYAATKGAVKCD